MKTAAFVLVSIVLLAGPASAAQITVQFAGYVSSTTQGAPSLRPGAPMVGHFTYDPQSQTSLQSASSPIMVIDFPTNGYRLEMNSYYLGVRNDWLDMNHTVRGDGFGLTFSHPLLQSGGGGLALDSSDTTLFNGNQFPTSLPPLPRFNKARHVSFHYDFQLDYWAVGCTIEALAVIPGPPTGQPIIFRLARDPETFRFRFIAEPSFVYTVESRENLTSGMWGTLTNVGPTAQKAEAIIRDSIATPGSRFYRIKRNPAP